MDFGYKICWIEQRPQLPHNDKNPPTSKEGKAILDRDAMVVKKDARKGKISSAIGFVKNAAGTFVYGPWINFYFSRWGNSWKSSSTWRMVMRSGRS